jgi:hypothetical protein
MFRPPEDEDDFEGLLGGTVRHEIDSIETPEVLYPPPGIPFGRAIRSFFNLRDGIVFLNHGSFGACPRMVLDYQMKLMLNIESHPDRYYRHELPGLVRRAAAQLGARACYVMQR